MRVPFFLVILALLSGVAARVFYGPLQAWTFPLPFYQEKAVSKKPEILPLELVGTVSQQQGTALAVIRDLQTKETAFYQIGETLPHGFILTQVASGRVVLRHADGGEIPLELEALAVTKDSPGDPGLRVTRYLNDLAVLIEGAQVKKIGKGSKKRLAAVMEGGRLTEHNVADTPFEKILLLLNLKDGDILLAINDQPLGSFQSASEILERALKELPLTLTVFQGREKRVFTYFLGGIAETIAPPSPGVPAPEGLPEPSPQPFTGKLLILGMVSGHAPRTMGVELRGPGGSEAVLVQIRPYTDRSGKFRGLEIRQMEPAEEAERIGLRVGDIITTVGGVRLTGLFQTLGTVKKAFKQASIEVEVSRGSETFIRTLERTF